MIQRSHAIGLLAFVLGAGHSGLAVAQATPMVDPSAPVYRDIDRLAAAGLIDTLIVGVRPFSEREVVRLLNEARRNLGRNQAAIAWAAPTITTDLLRYQRAGPRPLDELSLGAARMVSPYRRAPSDPNGSIDATINPLTANRGGRLLANGNTAEAESWHSLLLGSHLAIDLNPRLTIPSPASPDIVRSNLTVQSGGVDLLFGNFSVQVGREYAVFGQSPTGGLLLSQSAPTLDMIRFSNDRPTALPSFLRLLGPIRATLFVADLGQYEIHPQADLIGYHVAFLPHRDFELGLEVLDAMAGDHPQPASLADRVEDAIPIIDVFRSGSDFQFSNKMAGADFHWRVPSARGFELYDETVVDDFDARRLRSSLLEDGGYVAGTSLSCILQCGQFGVRLEYHQTGIRYYTHGDYPITSDRQLLGDPLGPRGLGGYLTVDGESARWGYLALNGAFEVRSGNTYGSSSPDPHDADFHFVLLGRRPGEKRTRTVLSWEPPGRDRRVTLRASGGVERVDNFAFVGGADRTNWLGQFELRFRP